MPASLPKVFFVAARMSAEFTAPLEQLRASAHVSEHPSLRSVIRSLQVNELPPELIVVAQSRPGEFLASELDEIVPLAPLARIVLLLGSWCEGETRTGKPWPGAKRVFWYDWPGQAERNLQGLSLARYVPWLSPATALEEERWLPPVAKQNSAGKPEIPTRCSSHYAAGPMVLVCTRRSSFGEALAIACREQGYSSICLRPERCGGLTGIAAIIWEGVQLLPQEETELRELSGRFPGTPIVGLADFPRWETEQRALAAGVSVLLAKPCDLDDLFWRLKQLIPAVGLPKKDAAEHAA